MKNLIFGIVLLSPPFLKKLILKWYCKAQFGRKSNIGWFSSIIGSRIKIGDYSTVKPLTLIRCDGEVTIGSYTEISSFSTIYGCSNFRVGDKCYIGPQVWINVSEDVIMGNSVGIGPRTMIFTHGSFLPYTEGYPVRFGRVIIGNNVWIPAGVFVQPGIEVGDNVLMNSRSVLTKSIPPGQYVVGFPAKPVRPIEQICRQVTPADRDHLISHILKHFISFLLQTTKGIEVIQQQDGVNAFRSHGREYLIVLVNSKGAALVDLQENRNRHVILLLNCPDWKFPFNDNKVIIFDFSTMKTSYATDRVHRELYEFFKRYYGIIFEFEGY